MSPPGRIHIGVGGWTFAPWRGVFYPQGLAQAKELHFASRRLTAIEINGTFYGSQKPESFRKWRDETPEGFVFTLKGPRYATNRRVLADAGESIGRFLASGVSLLGDRLGPLLWQLAATKTFDPDDIAAFMDLLPPSHDGLALRHVIEARHPSFLEPRFVALARERGVGIVYADHDSYAAIPDLTADFVYCRLQRGADAIDTGYPPADLDAWAGRLQAWAAGGAPADLPCVIPDKPGERRPRDVFAFVIHEGKVRAPAAAEALIARTGGRPAGVAP